MLLTSETSFQTHILRKITQPMRDEKREWVAYVPVLSFNPLQAGKARLIQWGGESLAPVPMSELFWRVLLTRPKGIVLIHNHPSGNVTPSLQDILTTDKIAELAMAFEIPLLGHAIVTTTQESWIPLKSVIAARDDVSTTSKRSRRSHAQSPFQYAKALLELRET